MRRKTDIGQGSYSGGGIKAKIINKLLKIPLLQRQQFWRHFSRKFNPCSHKLAFLAVYHWLQLVRLCQQHQDPKIHLRQKIREEQAEGMENGGMKRKGFWCNYGATSTRESRLARQVLKEIAQEVSKIRIVSSTQCQRKIKYLKDRYKEVKDHNRNKTGGERKTLPFYNEIDSVLGCRGIVTFSHVEESGPSSSLLTSSSSSSPVANGKGGSAESAQDDGGVIKVLLRGAVVLKMFVIFF